MISGPVPKRDAERRRANEPAGGPAEHLNVEDLPVADPDSLLGRIKAGFEPEQLDGSEFREVGTDRSTWHPLAQRIYDAALSSAQAALYEPSDWAVLALLCESLSRDLRPQLAGVTQGENSEPIYERMPVKGASLSAYLKGFTSLMMTEGDRRRMRLEVDRRQPQGVKAGVTDLKTRRRDLLA